MRFGADDYRFLLEGSGAADGLFASKPAPTLDL
jgi:hypothetical protein